MSSRLNKLTQVSYCSIWPTIFVQFVICLLCRETVPHTRSGSSESLFTETHSRLRGTAKWLLVTGAKRVIAVNAYRGVDPGGASPNILLMGPCINRAPPIIKLQNVHPCQSVIKIMFKLLNLASWLSGKSIESLLLDIKFLGVKMYKIRFRLRLRPRPHLRSLQRSPHSWLHLSLWHNMEIWDLTRP